MRMRSVTSQCTRADLGVAGGAHQRRVELLVVCADVAPGRSAARPPAPARPPSALRARASARRRAHSRATLASSSTTRRSYSCSSWAKSIGRTNQPILRSTSRKPSLRSRNSASRTGVRLTPRRCADLGLGEAVAGHEPEVVQLGLQRVVDLLGELARTVACRVDAGADGSQGEIRLTCAATTRQPSAKRTQVWLWRPVRGSAARAGTRSWRWRSRGRRW